MVRTQFPVWLILLAVALVPTLIGCGSTPPSTPPETSDTPTTGEATLTTLASATLPPEEYFDAALSHMDNAERAEFLNLRSDAERRRYLSTHGVDCRVDMDMALAPGMTIEQVKAVFTTDDHLWQDESQQIGGTTWHYFKRFAGQGYTQMYVIFRPGDDGTLGLVAWNAYSEADNLQDEQLYIAAGNISEALGRIIERGMAMQQIPVRIETRTREFARLLNTLAVNGGSMGEESPAAETLRIQFEESIRHYGLLADRVNPLEPPSRTPTLRDRDRYWEDLWRERTTNAEAFYAMNFREPDEIETVGRLTRWMYYLPHGERYLRYVIEFENQRVTTWWAEPVREADLPEVLVDEDA